MADFDGIDWGKTARLEREERRAWREQGIVLVRVDSEPNKLLRRLAEDRAMSRFGARQTPARPR